MSFAFSVISISAVTFSLANCRTERCSAIVFNDNAGATCDPREPGFAAMLQLLR